jgi:hypothetical protein
LKRKDCVSLGLGWSRLSDAVVALVATLPKPYAWSTGSVWKGVV